MLEALEATDNIIPSINFEFLRPENHRLANLGALAEKVVYVDPGSAQTRLRAFAEQVVFAIYREERFPRDKKSSLNDLLKMSFFEAAVNPSLLHRLSFLKDQGNQTAHGDVGSLRQATMGLGIAHSLGQYVACKYYVKRQADLPSFQDIPAPQASTKKQDEALKKQLAEKEAELQKALAQVEAERAKVSAKLPEPTPAAIQQSRARSEQVADSLQWDEATTRAQLIDAMLLQAGWDVNDSTQVEAECKVTFHDNTKGFVDYVLWSDNGQPLAVVEAKKAAASAQLGREQARLYADAFEHMGYQRPVIFYTNGYETYLWDDLQYNSPRAIYGFYSKSSVEYLIYQRHYRTAELEKKNPSNTIAGRTYQIECIKTVAAHFQKQHRKALIIQATGTGKTRVSIGLTELLAQNGWAKRILFLCDRKELRSQADEAYKEHLPSEPRCVIGETSQIDPNARVYIATYPGMMNRFAQLDVGFFDLIIADESHRSIYNRYRDIFDYFDALQVGLTATPVKFISRNTFGMFDCKNTDPTFEFGLDAAINNDPPYLVNFTVKDLTTEFLRDGIHYSQLSDDQKEQLEEDLGEEEAKNTTIKGKDIGRKIFSRDTDRTILENLMNNGVKDATGSLVGKTIVFAQRQDHAEHLEKLFCELYPQHGNKVCKVIHNKTPKVSSLIKEFKQGDNAFRIAISVDMLDTGIDVPEVVNLVFAKPVKSWVKFWQMIGRGTRLCENLFGEGKHKTEFVIFDHYGNFEYFEEEYKEAEDTGSKSLLQATFEARLALTQAALKANHTAGFDTGLQLVREDLNDLPQDSVAVKKHLRALHQLQQTDQLQRFDASIYHLLANTFAPLMGARVLQDQNAVQMDKRIALLETALVAQAASFQDERDRLLEALDTLAVTIQAVRNKQAVIDEVKSPEFWASVTIERLEWARVELRGIMKYRQKLHTFGYTTPTTDTTDGNVVEEERKVVIAGANAAVEYRRRLKAILDEMVANNPTLQKIHQGEPVDESELKTLTSTILTTHPQVPLDVLNEFYGRTADQLHVTVREIIGMDSAAVERHFERFLHEHPSLTAKQVQFMNLLKGYIAQYGSIEVEKLYEAPFTALDHDGLDGIFSDTDADQLVEVLRPFYKPETTPEETASGNA